jgi:hypothetical protein
MFKSTCPVSSTKKQIQADSLLPWSPPNLWHVYVSLFARSNFGAVPDLQLPLFMPLSSAIFSPVDHSRVPTCSSQKKSIFVLLPHAEYSRRIRTGFALTGETFGHIIKIVASRQTSGHKLPKIGGSMVNASLEKREFLPEI